ncbi:MAG: YibE/F family protein [Patescibacteria group bacterium]
MDNSFYARGKVLNISKEGAVNDASGSTMFQDVTLEIQSGAEHGKVVNTEYSTAAASFERQKLHVGEQVVMAKTTDVRGDTYYVLDSFRLPVVGIFLLIFFVLAAFFGRGSGARAVLGLGVSLLVLMVFVVPRIFVGENPILICGLGAAMIAVISILLSHGIKLRSFVALGSTLIALVVAFVLSAIAVKLAALSGGGTEEAVFLQQSVANGLDLQGLLLGAMVIGTLGVLDDVTTAQVASVEEIHNANDRLTAKELYQRGISVGREHIASLVNTLALAYVGASFPIFLLFSMPDNPPLWVLLNTEQIMEEAVRALVGGGALILAVPISTVLAAYIFANRKVTKHNYD